MWRVGTLITILGPACVQTGRANGTCSREHRCDAQTGRADGTRRWDAQAGVPNRSPPSVRRQ